VTITRHDHPVAHVISAGRLAGILESLELQADPNFVRQLKRLRAGKLKFRPVSSLAD
jgi:PHD/YefM family antitoxin component YafN of YafNO toxin-antitoxin module